MSGLSDHDLASLHVQMVAPMVVADLLNGREAFDDVAEYALNDLMCGLDADSALLCVALCAQRISAASQHIAMGRLLGLEAERIVEDYGPLWLIQQHAPDLVDQVAAIELLTYVPEDLEAIAHILDATLAELVDSNLVAAGICDLLALQAHEHVDTIEAELFATDIEPASQIVLEFNRPGMGNIIPFPAFRRSGIDSQAR